MMKMKLLPLAICLASAPVFALEQGEYRLNYFAPSASPTSAAKTRAAAMA
jgi:hypothetical protein